MSKQKKNNKKMEEELEMKRLKLLEEKKEENKKFGIKKVIENFYLIFTEYFIKEVWDDNNPIEFTKNYIFLQFNKLKIKESFKDEEIIGFSHYIINCLIEFEKYYKLNDYKLLILLNLNFYLFIFNDDRFKVYYPIINDDFEEIIDENNKEENKEDENLNKDKKEEFIMEYDEFIKNEKIKIEKRDNLILSSIKNKNSNNDIKCLNILIKKLIEFKIDFILPKEIKILLNFINEYYLNYYNLFRFMSLYNLEEKEKIINVEINKPFLSEDLKNSKLILDFNENKKDFKKEIENNKEDLENKEINKEVEEEKDEWLNLDDNTVELIKEELRNTKEFMENQLKIKEDELIENSNNNKKKKKKKK